MNAYLHSVRKPLKACCRPHTGRPHIHLAATSVVCRTGLRVWASVVKVLSVGNRVSGRGKVDVGGRYHFILPLLSQYSNVYLSPPFSGE